MIPICAFPKRFACSLPKTAGKHSRRHLSLVPPRYRGLQTSGFPLYQFSVTASFQSKSNSSEESKAFARKLSTAPHKVANEELSSIDTQIEERVSFMELYGPRPIEWYTGLPPSENFTSSPQFFAKNGQTTREELQEYFDNTWTLTENLLASLQGDDAFMRPPYHNLRHPMIFYYGHPATLYINKLRVAGLLSEPINPYYEVIFETGVDEMSWDDLSKNEMEWPSVQDVHEYRKVVYRTVSSVIRNLTDEQLSNVTIDRPVWSLLMGFEHERIHLETSSYLISEMPNECVRFPKGFPPYHPSVERSTRCEQGEKDVSRPPECGVDYPENSMIAVAETKVTMGKQRDVPSFGWDNEYGRREFTVPAFKASKYLVSNGEFLEFMRDGGYGNRSLWTDKGWEWRAYRNVKNPNLWVRRGPQGHHEYDLRLVFDTVPMQWDWPVAICQHEAAAYAKWKGKMTGKHTRVLTELEHRALRVSDEDHTITYGGDSIMEACGYNLNLSYSSPCPVNLNPPNAKGFHDVFGNAWQWTEDYFCALPGFQVHPYYEDFSTPCFDGLHHVIQGGSFISTGNEASVHARFHFRPHFYQHASVRLVEVEDSNEPLTSDTDAPGPFVGSYPYRQSKDALLARTQSREAASRMQHRHSHVSKQYGELITKEHSPVGVLSALAGPLAKFSLNSFAQSIVNTAKECLSNSDTDASRARVIEVGCGAGRLSLALAESFHTVIGVDHDQELVELANTVADGQSISFDLRGEGAQESSFKTDPTLLPKRHAGGMVDFRCADPMCLPAEWSGFDMVILNDVIDKVSSPNAVLGRLSGARGLLRTGGILCIASAFQWKEDTTPKSLWFGGHSDGAEGPQSSLDALKTKFEGQFSLLKTSEVPVLWASSLANIDGKMLQVSFWQRDA